MSEVNKEDPCCEIRKRKKDKIRRRDSRAAENVTKEINLLPEPQRFSELLSKYSSLYDEYRSCHSSQIQSEKQITTLQKEKNQLQMEQSKLVFARSRMESLCRELQRQNKLIKEENIAKFREEEEKQKELGTKFQITLNELMSMMQETTEKNVKLRDDNLDMANKIESLCKQFEERKEHQNKIELQIELEKQLSQAQIDKVKLEFKAEREGWIQERDILLEKFAKREEKCIQLQNTVKTLQDNLAFYSGKYQEFRSSFAKTNQVFDNCKSEMGKMTKKMMMLENEGKMWKQQSQKNAQSVLELSADKRMQEQVIDVTEKKVSQLQKLCRQLQADRSSYLKLLKSHGITPTSERILDDQIISSSESPTKKEQHLEQLKDNLKVLQNQLNSIKRLALVDAINNIMESPNAENDEGTTVTDVSPVDVNINKNEDIIQSTEILPVEDVN